MFCMRKKVYPAYVSKHNSNHENQVIVLIIPNGKGHETKSEGGKTKSKVHGRWHYLAV